MSIVPVTQAIKTLWHATAVAQDSERLKKEQKAFLEACTKDSCLQTSGVSTKIPLSTHVKGFTHLAAGDTSGSAFAEDAITRTAMVLGSGARQNIGAMPILGGVVTRNISDGLLNDWNDHNLHRKYNPGDDLGAMHGCEPDWCGNIFDIVVVSIGDMRLTADAPERLKCKTTKIFRIEGESAFLSKDGVLRFEANGRLFSGIGGSIIKSPDVAQMAYHVDGDTTAHSQLKNSVFYMVNRDATKKEEYDCPRLLEYRDAVNELSWSSAKSYPALRRLDVNSFRVVTSNPDRMLRYIPFSSSPGPADVIRVDITKTSTGCLQPVYAPIIEETPPSTYKEAYCAWLAGVPSRLKQHMYHQHVTYGCVRTFAIQTSTFSKASLESRIAETITDQELKRLHYGPVSVSSLSQAGIDSVEVRFEPVRRLRQTREVKCSRRLIGDIYHGRYVEYLAEFGDGSTSWIPSCNVADDLKQEFWNVTTSGAEGVAEIVDSDVNKGMLTVKRADGRRETISQTQILWQPESPQEMLSDVELEAALRHAHYGVDYTDFIPCEMLVESDWGRVELLSHGTMIMQDPAAAKAGEYADVRLEDGRSLQLGGHYSFKFNQRTIPFLIASNGAPFDVRMSSGWYNGEPDRHKGRITLTVRDEIFENVFDPADESSNKRTVHIRPRIATPGLLTIETNWGAIEVTSADATIGPDPTVDQSVYREVVFDGRSLTQCSRVFGEKFVVPFLLFSREEQVDIAITHGADKGPGRGDCSGTATATFGKGTYTSPCDLRNPSTNFKAFKGCRVSENPPVVPKE